MPKAGKYDYPARDLDDCLKYLEKAHRVANSLVMKRDSFAKNIGLSPKGGGFGLLLSSMSMFGLIDNTEGDIRYTSLAEKILFGQKGEREEAKETAVRNVQLFADISDTYGSDPDLEQLRHILREKAGVPIAQEEKIASEVGKLFKKNSQHLKVGGDTKKMQTQQQVTPRTGSGLFTVTAKGLTIDVDSMFKVSLVEKLVEDAKEKLSKQESIEAKEPEEQEVDTQD